MNKDKKILFSWKRIIAVFMLFTMLAASVAGVSQYFGPVAVRAENAVATGHVNSGVSGLRVRTQPDTQTGQIITVVDDSFTFDIYETVYTSDTYYWYKIGFDYNGSYTYGYISGEYTSKDNSYSEDIDFESYLNEQGFPDSYKDGLRQLHADYPKWVFVADHVGKDWNEVIDNENVIGRSLIYGSAKSSWKSVESGCYNWNSGEWTEMDSGGWVQASRELIEYTMDPRNFLSNPYIFMFESLAYDSSLQNESGVEQIISGTFMENSSHDLSFEGNDYTYASGLMLAGRQSGVSPYHLATRILQEQGNTGYGSCISGNVAGYRGYYNYYNQGAVKSGNISAVVNGMIYASRSDSDSLRPWNTRMKSIVGGAKMIGSSYINRGQSTIYYEKFDVVSSSPYWHQYMTNVMAPRSESQKAANAYSDSTKYNTGLVFTIPVYDNMPQETCTAPDGDGDPGNLLSDMYVDGHSITPSFKKYTQDYSLIVDNNVDRININASAISGSSWIDGAGEHRLNVGENNIEVTVHAQNGSDRTYYLTVVRKEPSENPNPPSPDPAPENPSFDTGYNLDSDNMYISGVKAGDNAGTVLGNVRTQNATAYICNRNGDRKGDGDIIATGDRLVINDNSGNEYASYTFVVYGDINGDGEIDLIDIVKIKRHILELSQLNGEFLRAADINRDGDVDLIDIVAVKRHILGMKEITQ